MPASLLWAVDLFGRVHTLSTAGQYWEPCRDVQLEFKRVSATSQCCWGIACDNQVYVFVCASDVPIRRREEAYENQVATCVHACSGCHPRTPASLPIPTLASCTARESLDGVPQENVSGLGHTREGAPGSFR